jgi:lysophospholipase L1-like esterase
MPSVRHRAFGAFAAAVFAMLAGADIAHAQTAPAGAMQISWEVRNRFRLFREERDFLLHVEAARSRTILGAEQALAIQSDGRGWARNTLSRLCIDQAGKIAQPCMRDGVGEDYLTPAEHAVTVRLTGQVPQGATCAWKFDDGSTAQEQAFDCLEPINIRLRFGQPTMVTVDVNAGPEVPERLTEEILVRDILIAGLGDSIASGEGNPDRPVELSSGGFCFRNYLGGGEYYRPGRARFQGDKSCGTSGALPQWQRFNAQWSNAACHRSLYSYQARTALALAVYHPHVAVTFLPLACSGATIERGLLGTQRARECLITRNSVNCQGTVNAQVAELRETLAAVTRRQKDRQLDLIFLSVGANDIDFSGLVADVIVEKATERSLFYRGGVLGSVDASRAALTRNLPQDFARLRDALKPLVGGDLARVVYVSYANPALANDAPCTNGRDGFDIHPAFNADPQRLANVVSYVQNEFLPRLKDLALCEGGVICRDPRADRMTLVDGHQAAFAGHGMCARSGNDPEFDQQCFSVRGESFQTDPVAGASNPMVCGQSATEFRAYSPRARWIRTANDSYFAAMTYPQGLQSSMQPTDIHDASWGVLSAVYGGAVHPTAEGHAVMADAALPAAISVLGLAASRSGTEELVRRPLRRPE